MKMSSESIPRLDAVREKRRQNTEAPVDPLPSQNVDMEAKLLSVLVWYSDALPIVRRELRFPAGSRVRPFYKDAHQTIYDTACELYDRGEIPEIETLTDELERTGKIERVTRPTLNEIMRATADDATIGQDSEYRAKLCTQWARRLKQHALRRAMIDVATTAAGIAYVADDQATKRDAIDEVRNLSETVRHLAETPLDNSRFRLKTIADLRQRKQPAWLVPGMFMERKITLIFGESNTGKSFYALDVALRQSEHGPVVYVCAEGIDGIRNRVDAWLLHNGWEDAPNFFVIDESPNLLETGDVLEVIAQAKSLDVPVRAVFFDTLAASMEGADENSPEDMGAAVGAMRRVQRECDTAVFVVHHSGKDRAKGMRGHSSLRGAIDTAVEVTKDGDLVTLRCDKQREAARFDSLAFNLTRVALDETGDITSCVLMPTSCAVVTKKQSAKLSRYGTRLLEIFQTNRSGGTHGDMRRIFMDITGAASRTFDNALDQLYDAGYIANYNGLWKLVPSETEAN